MFSEWYGNTQFFMGSLGEELYFQAQRANGEGTANVKARFWDVAKPALDLDSDDDMAITARHEHTGEPVEIVMKARDGRQLAAARLRSDRIAALEDRADEDLLTSMTNRELREWAEGEDDLARITEQETKGWSGR